MRLYVAAQWSDRAEVRQVMGQLIASGHQITHNWTNLDQFSRLQAALDFQGVEEAEALVFVANNPYDSTGGAFVEMGIALGRGIPVFVIGPGIDRNIFTLLPQIRRGITALLTPYDLVENGIIEKEVAHVP